jgi:hypothetical protein
MVLTTKEASEIIVLAIVLSVLPIRSILLKDGYHVRFTPKTVHKGEEEPMKHHESPRNKSAKSNYFLVALLMPFPIPIQIPFP